MATQVAALTYQSQLTQSTAATIGHRQELQLAQLAAAQEAQHATMHQIIEGLNAVAFNASDASRGMPTFGGHGGNQTVMDQAVGHNMVVAHPLVGCHTTVGTTPPILCVPWVFPP